jgi:hypothetical protein|nr:MAG TPA: hypothetical protein [Caudoviricetes sp.]
MDRYKPEYLGKVIPADDATKMYDFVKNKSDMFNDIYDACKENSECIDDISVVKTNDDSLSVKVSTDTNTLEAIRQEASSKESLSMQGDVITAV